MKRLFKLLAILTIVIILPVNAETTTNKTGANLEDNSGYTNLCVRDSSNNYGVKKRTKKELSTILNYVNATPCVNVEDKVYDFSDILTEAEEETIKLKFLEYKKKYNVEIVFVSYNLPYTVDNDNLYWADDFYRFNDFGLEYSNYDGILIFRNTYYADPFYTVISEGNAQLYLSASRLSDLEDDIYSYFSTKQYTAGIDKVLSRIDRYYNQDPIKGTKINEYGDIEYYWYPHWFFYTISGLIVGLIYMLVGRGKHKMVKKATAAREYYVKDSLNLTQMSDVFLRSHTSSYTVSSSSGGGGGHSGGGHSGGGFSSGGGRHG